MVNSSTKRGPSTWCRLNLPLLFVLSSVCVGLALLILTSISNSSLQLSNVKLDAMKELNLTQLPLPAPLSLEDVQVVERRVDVHGVSVFYREARKTSESSKLTFLLLHGMAFTSATWMELKTVEILAALGHHVLAVDLPGYGESKSSGDWSSSKLVFMSSLVSSLTNASSKVVVVSPSMSGSFSMELLVHRPEQLCALVTVAPVGTTHYTDTQLSAVNVPVMIVVGEMDKTLGTESTRQLSKIPTATKPQVFANGRHPCYLDDPHKWHLLLHNFASHIQC